MWDCSPSNQKDLRKKHDIRLQELRDLYVELGKCIPVLGKDVVRKLKIKLAEGFMRTDEAEYLQSMRRDECAAELGKSRKEYEGFLGGRI